MKKCPQIPCYRLSAVASEANTATDTASLTFSECGSYLFGEGHDQTLRWGKPMQESDGKWSSTATAYIILVRCFIFHIFKITVVNSTDASNHLQGPHRESPKVMSSSPHGDSRWEHGKWLEVTVVNSYYSKTCRLSCHQQDDHSIWYSA